MTDAELARRIEEVLRLIQELAWHLEDIAVDPDTGRVEPHWKESVRAIARRAGALMKA